MRTHCPGVQGVNAGGICESTCGSESSNIRSWALPVIVNVVCAGIASGGFHLTRVKIRNPKTGELLSETLMGESEPGVYYRWGVRGPLNLQFIRESGSASVNAFFLDRAVTYQDWVAVHFPAADLEMAGPNADPDSDGDSNLAEYALGSDPRVKDTAVSAMVMPEGHVVFSVHLDNSAIEAVPLMEYSENLVHWFPLEASEILMQVLASYGSSELRYSFPPSEAGARFLRVRIGDARSQPIP